MTLTEKRTVFPPPGPLGGFLVSALTVFLAAVPAIAGPDDFRVEAIRHPDSPVRTMQVLGPVFRVDRKYRSMKGPYDSLVFQLDQGEEGEPAMAWITGYEATMVDASGGERMPAEYMCHSNLDLDYNRHAELFGDIRHNSDRLFTLSQGQLQLHFPEGFGIPVRTDEPLSLAVQVLNLNHEGDPVAVRHRITVDYVLDREAGPMKPLFTSFAQGMVLLDGPDGYYGVEKPDFEKHGLGCAVGQPADHDPYTDQYGRSFSGHWVVPPGRQEVRALNTRLMNLPFDTTIHYIAVHLHPFAESIALRDLTTGETIFQSRARNYPDRIGLDHVDYYSDPEGIPVFQDHEYEVVTVYNNTSGEDQDSMAVLYLYLLDKAFSAPSLARR